VAGTGVAVGDEAAFVAVASAVFVGVPLGGVGDDTAGPLEPVRLAASEPPLQATDNRSAAKRHVTTNLFTASHPYEAIPDLIE
jgi:hypothetical protein